MEPYREPHLTYENWPLDMRTHVGKFPDCSDLSPIANMGFPAGWHDLDLWKEPTGLSTQL